MTKVAEIFEKNQKRIQQLENRRERLIIANQSNSFNAMIETAEGFVENPKSEKYNRIMLNIRVELYKLARENKELREVKTAELYTPIFEMFHI